jgi:ribosomal-protein-serine acetyltransferase
LANELKIELGGGAVLRSLAPEHAEALFRMVDSNRVRLSRWFPWVDDATAESQVGWLAGSNHEEQPYAPAGIWVNDELVGTCDLSIERLSDTGELGFWLDESAVGRGFVTRGCQALLRLGFEDAGLHRVQLRAGVENLRSRAVAKRLKMREEGLLRGAGKVGGGLYVDLVMYGLLADEWQVSR